MYYCFSLCYLEDNNNRSAHCKCKLTYLPSLQPIQDTKCTYQPILNNPTPTHNCKLSTNRTYLPTRINNKLQVIKKCNLPPRTCHCLPPTDSHSQLVVINSQQPPYTCTVLKSTADKNLDNRKMSTYSKSFLEAQLLFNSFHKSVSWSKSPLTF